MKKRLLFLLIAILAVSGIFIPRAYAGKYVLDNGITVIIKEDGSSPLVALKVLVGVGSANEQEFMGSGISHLVEHMLFKGTATRRVGDIEKEIKSYGGTINAFTTHDYSGYQIVVPTPHASKCLAILKDVLFNSSLDKKELEKEKQVILKEIKLNRDEPARRLSRLLWSTAFRLHPYRHPVIGYQNLFERLDRASAFKFYKKMYIPNNITLVVVGDVDEESIHKDIEAIFGDIEREPLLEMETPGEPRQISKRIIEERDEVTLAYFGLAYRSVDLFDKDLFSLDVLSIILGDGASSRLNQRLYRDEKIVYSVGSWNYTPGDPGLFIISGVAEPDKVDAAIESILDEIEKIKDEGIKDEELAKAKNSVLTAHISTQETVSGQAGDLGSSELLTGDHNFSDRYVKGINSVSDDGIRRAASKHLIEDSLSVVRIMPQGWKDPSKAKAKKKTEKGRIRKYILSNGIKLLLREDREVPLVSIKAMFTGGLRTENKDTNGISNLAGAMLLKGTDSRTEEEISKTVESLGGGIGYVSGNNSFGVGLTTLSKDLDTGLELLKDVLFFSNCPEEILEREKASVLAAIKSEEDDVYRYSMRILKENIFRRHPYRFRAIGSIESVEKIGRTDIMNYYKMWARPNNMVLGVFGDIDASEALEKIESEFLEIKKGISPVISIPKERGPATRREVRKELKKAQSVVMAGFLGTTINSKDRYTLSVISSILSGKDGRLSMRIRERLGLAYTLGSFSLPGIDPGYYLFYVGTSSENIPTVKKELTKQIHLLIKKYVADEELKLAKAGLIGNHRIGLQTNSSLAFRACLDELYGLGYDDYLNYSQYIEKVTKEEILRVANKYFNPDSGIMVVVEGK